jgi:hypothetical protein
VLGDETTEAQPFVQLTNQNQATVGGDARSLEVDLEKTVERELKRLVLFVTHWVSSSIGVFTAFKSLWILMRTNIRETRTRGSKRKCGVIALTVSIIYCGLFVSVMVQFAFARIPAIELIDVYKSTRPLVAFLVTGMIAFYFGSSRRA